MNVPASVNVNSTNITVIPIEITNSVDVYEINKDNSVQTQIHSEKSLVTAGSLSSHLAPCSTVFRIL